MQQNFVFKKYYQEFFQEGHFPPEHLTWQDYIKDKLNRKGFLVNNLKEIKGILITCFVAKANISLKERKKSQKDIDNKK